MTGFFISLEGGEGTGKSTQCKALSKELDRRSINTVVTREPGGTPSAENIRQMLLTGHDGKWSIESEALLFAAARADHVKKHILPSLEKGCWVISDRFVDSSRAYQTISRALSDEQIMQLHDIGSGGLLPGRTFILDLPDDIAAQRAHARDRGDSDRIGGRDTDYHSQVMQNFRQLAVREPERVRIIDAAQSAEQVTENILSQLSDILE